MAHSCDRDEKIPSSCQSRKEIADLLVDVHLLRNCLGDFITQQFSVSFAQPMHGHLHRSLSHTHCLGRWLIGDCIPVSGHVCLQVVEQVTFVFVCEFGLKTCHGLV
jgi:hypothetical protein